MNAFHSHPAPYANIDAALTYAMEAGVRIRYDVNGVLAAIQNEVGTSEPIIPEQGWSVEIGSKNGRPWHIHVATIEVTTTEEEGETYTDATVPAGVAVTLSELGRGGVSIDFPPGPAAA